MLRRFSIKKTFLPPLLREQTRPSLKFCVFQHKGRGNPRLPPTCCFTRNCHLLIFRSCGINISPFLPAHTKAIHFAAVTLQRARSVPSRRLPPILLKELTRTPELVLLSVSKLLVSRLVFCLILGGSRSFDAVIFFLFLFLRVIETCPSILLFNPCDTECRVFFLFFFFPIETSFPGVMSG